MGDEIRIKPIELIAGVDDATRCPVIGSIMVAGVLADPAILPAWQEAGVTDSKLVSRRRRDRLVKMIRSTAIATSVIEIPPILIDDKHHNLNMWEMVAVIRILQNLRRRAPFRTAYIDNWEVNETNFYARLRQALGSDCVKSFRERDIRLQPRTIAALDLRPEHHADENHTIVGAASILAKYTSDRQYERFRKEYGDFGSGNPGDRKTRRFIWDRRHNPPPIVRTSWKTFQIVMEMKEFREDAGVKRPSPRRVS